MSKLIDMPLDEIVMDTITQSRVSMDLELVEAYADAMVAGDTFPAIVVFEQPGHERVFLADGWYRTMAAKQAGIGSLLAEVIAGGIDEAILYAAGANSQHGIRRSDADKRKAVKMLLDHPRWSSMSNRAIAEAARVGGPFVAKVREEVQSVAPEEDQSGGTVIGKDGKSYPAKAKKEKPAKVERGVLDILKEISKLYLELPREPADAVSELTHGGECLSAGRGDHIAWWFGTYAKIIKEHTEDEDIVIDVPDEAA